MSDRTIYIETLCEHGYYGEHNVPEWDEIVRAGNHPQGEVVITKYGICPGGKRTYLAPADYLTEEE